MSTTLVELDQYPPSVIGLPIRNSPSGLSDEAEEIANLDMEIWKQFLFPISTAQRHLEDQFRLLVEKWHRNTATSSSIDQYISEENFLRIVGLGEAAIPLILAELQKTSSLLFAALAQITGENPVNREHRGDIVTMTKDWLDWGARKGLL